VRKLRVEILHLGAAKNWREAKQVAVFVIKRFLGRGELMRGKHELIGVLLGREFKAQLKERSAAGVLRKHWGWNFKPRIFRGVRCAL
jgi:hypothetical protein